jgi:hypothetical protein
MGLKGMDWIQVAQDMVQYRLVWTHKTSAIMK